MRNLRSPDIDRYRIALPFSRWPGDETCGAFSLPSVIDRQPIKIIASSGEGWDHVSVSRRNRPPNWAEMEQIAALFFLADECAMQLHVPASDHVNNHPHCLHWWRPHDAEIPRPPSILVGVKEAGIIASREAARRIHAEALASERE